MKKLIFCWLLSVVFLSTAHAQYGTGRTGYEGDYFSLEGALDLFKQSHTLRDFERKLNTEENWVNNLDLDYDGRIDYIRVEHRRQGNFHAIVLQALVDRYDVQDVAVIEIEIIGRGEAVLQIVGDEGLYGEEVIVEPAEGYSDSRGGRHLDYGDYVNVYYWEPVQYILGRQYVVYTSPYRWQYYPAWWRPWVQCSWSVFRPRIVIYHRHYHVVHVHRVVRVHNFYRPYRSYSHVVVQRTNTVRASHGKPPVHNPAPAVRQDRGSSGYRSRKDVVEQPGTTTRSNTLERSPSVSRKDTPSSGQKATRSTPPQVKQPSRSTTTRSTTPVQKPSVNSRKATPPSRTEAARSPAPQVKQPSRSTTTRSTTPVQKPSVNSRKATPSSRTEAARSPAPQVKQPSRNTTTRSTTPVQKPSVNSRKSAPASTPKAGGSTAPKSSSRGKSRTKGN